MLGDNLNLEPTINRMEKMCLPHLIRGISLFQETHSSRGDTIHKLHNNLLMDKCQIHLIILKTHPVILRSHMFLKTPQILCTLVNTNLTQEDPLVTIIRITQCMVLLVSLCHTSITHRLTLLEKTGPRSNKIKKMQKQKHRRHTIQERHRFTWFTQCGLRPPEKLPGPSFIIIQQMKGYNLQQNPL
jgi:hypothetical protein